MITAYMRVLWFWMVTGLQGTRTRLAKLGITANRGKAIIEVMEHDL